MGDALKHKVRIQADALLLDDFIYHLQQMHNKHVKWDWKKPTKVKLVVTSLDGETEYGGILNCMIAGDNELILIGEMK